MWNNGQAKYVGKHPQVDTLAYMHNYVVVQFGLWFNFDFPLFDIHYHILA